MDELLELLNQAENLESLTDDELDALEAGLREQGEALLDGELTDEVLEVLDRAATAAETVRTTRVQREEAEAERQQRAAAAAERLRGPVAETPEGEGEDETPPEGETPEGEGEEEGAQAETEREPVAASGAPRTPGRVTRVASRRPASMQPRRSTPPTQPLALVAAANLGHVQAGTRLDTNPDLLAGAMIEAYRQSQGYRGPRAQIPVARVVVDDPADLFGEERTLRNESPIENTAKIDAVTSARAITAAGGICAPLNVRREMPTIGDTDRPVRDEMLVRFGADQGGIKTLPPPTLSDVSGAVAAWTHATDVTPGVNTKPCISMTCPSGSETLVDAITRCIQVGNFRARFFPEQVQAWLDLAAVQHARFSETRILTAIGAGSVAVTAPQLLDALTDVLTTLDRLTASIRSRRRLAANFPMRVGFPFWLRDLIRSGIARRLPYGTLDEQYAIADAQIDAWMRTRNVNLTWFLDGEAGQVFGAQGAGAVLAWPTSVIGYAYPEGSWLFLDGGQLDLGIVRDSTLNATNNYQLFAESFENVHFHGQPETYRMTLDLCADGSVAGTVGLTCAGAEPIRAV